MTSPLRDAESATAGVPVVRGLVWRAYDNGSCWASDPTGFAAYQALSDGWRHRNGGLIDVAGGIQAAKAAAQADYEQRITAALNPDFLSALDTARAEIERLRERLRDIIDERDNLSTIIATEIDDVAGVELDDMEERATRAESALTAAQARIAELEADQRLFDLHAEALAEIKATVDGQSDQQVKDIIYGLLAEIATLSPAVKEPK